MNYQEAVTEARQLVKRSEEDQWRLAQLTWQQVQGGASRNQWASDTGMARSHVQALYKIWDEWGGQPLATRPAFGEAYYRMHTPGRHEDREQIGSRAGAEAVRHVRNMPPEQKASVVRELIDDPDVSARVMRDPHTRANVVRAQRQAWDEQEQAAKEQVKADPHLNAAQEAVLALSIENDLGMARWRIAEATRKRMELADSRTGQYADAVRQIEDALRQLLPVQLHGRDQLIEDQLGGGLSRRASSVTRPPSSAVRNQLADLLAEGGGDQSDRSADQLNRQRDVRVVERALLEQTRRLVGDASLSGSGEEEVAVPPLRDSAEEGHLGRGVEVRAPAGRDLNP